MKSCRRHDSIAGGLFAIFCAQNPQHAPWLDFTLKMAGDFPFELPSPEETLPALDRDGLQGRTAALALGACSVYRDPEELVAHVTTATDRLASQEAVRRGVAALLGAALPFIFGNIHATQRHVSDVHGAIEEVAPFAPRGAGAFLERLVREKDEPARSKWHPEKQAVRAALRLIREGSELDLEPKELAGLEDDDRAWSLTLCAYIVGAFKGAALMHDEWRSMREELAVLLRGGQGEKHGSIELLAQCLHQIARSMGVVGR